MTNSMNKVLCSHCEKPVESRGNLRTVLNVNGELLPLHETCLKKLRQRGFWHHFTLMSVGPDGVKATKMLRWGHMFLGEILWVGILLGFLLSFDLPWWGYALFIVLTIPAMVIWGFLPSYWMTDWMVRTEMEPYKKQSWDEYESQLPE